jgi:hypothetical protein
MRERGANSLLQFQRREYLSDAQSRSSQLEHGGRSAAERL